MSMLWYRHEGCCQRAGIADGGELEFRPPGTTAWLFDKVKYSELKLGFIRQALNHSTAELPLLITPMSSPTIGNTNVSSIPFSVARYKLKISLAFFQFFFKIGLLTEVSPFEGSPEK